jgi:ribosomal-protein-alanine N-acetyltransferase
VLVGYGGWLFAEEDAHITNIADKPDWHLRGVATEMMLELAAEARNRECEALTLEVRHTNTAAQELYRRFGFVPAGIRQKYYENTDDAIVMWCTDIQSDEYSQRLDKIVQSRP